MYLQKQDIFNRKHTVESQKKKIIDTCLLDIVRSFQKNPVSKSVTFGY